MPKSGTGQCNKIINQPANKEIQASNHLHDNNNNNNNTKMWA
jgi:hypothetical protein